MTIVSGTPPRMYACHVAEELEIDLAGQPQAADEQTDEAIQVPNDGRPEAEPPPGTPTRDLVDDRVHGALDAAGFERGLDGPALADAQRGILPLDFGGGAAMTPPPVGSGRSAALLLGQILSRTTSRTSP